MFASSTELHTLQWRNDSTIKNANGINVNPRDSVSEIYSQLISEEY